MFDRSASVKLQLRDKKGKWIKMGMHVKWHSLEDDADVTGIARGESGNNIIVEFSHGGQTYHINVPHDKVEGIDEKAHLDPTYVEHMGGHINSPNIADHGVTVNHTVTNYGVTSKNPNVPLTTKISDLKPGDVVYPIKNHDATTPSSIQKSPYNVKEPTTMANMQKFATSGHGVVKKIVHDDEGKAKYAIITDKKGKDHYPSASHYAVKQHDTLDQAILKGHADESQAMGHTTKSGLVDDVKGTHTTQDKFDASKAPVGTKVESTGVNGTKIPLTKTGENEWVHEANGTKLGDEVVDHMMGPAPEKAPDTHLYIAPQTTEPAAKETPLDISGWTKKPGTQMGSNAGGIYTDQHGNDWYVKLSQSDDHARSEVLADDLYKAAGVQTSNLKLADVGGGKLGTASQMMPDTKKDLYSHLHDPAYMAKIQDGFAMDALLANWDVAGLGYDNIITDQHGNPVRVDPGGALLFRAQGQPKGDQFGNKVGEWESLRGQGSHSNSQASALFGNMTDQQLAVSAKHVEALTPEKINAIVDSIGFDNKTSAELKDKLAARREDILSRAAKLEPAPATPATHEPAAEPSAPSETPQAPTVHEPASEPAPPAETPQAPAAPAASEPASHPDFNATYPDKGKDQIDANGKTIKVNDLIHHPKKGVGKVFIGLPSTNSVKVVYPDGSKATHLSKAVTKVEGNAPKVKALPSDLKVGDHGIDPATHTAFIVGNNNSLIHVGDTVTHSNGDKGVVKGIYKGEKTVKVEWADGHTSGPKKASTLESESKHVPGEPTAHNEEPTTPHESAPVSEPAHEPVPEQIHETPPAPEPAHEEPAAPTPAPASEPVPASEKTTPLVGKSLGDAGVPPVAALPVGSVIENKSTSTPVILTKTDNEGMWKSQSGTFMHEGTVEHSHIVSGHDWKIVSMPTDGNHAVAPSEHTPIEDVSAKDPSDLSKEEFSKLPIGTTMYKDPESSFYQKKVGDNQWQMQKLSTGQPAFGHTNTDEEMHGVLQNTPGLYQSMKLPETTAESPTAHEDAPSVPSTLHDPSVEDLAKLPDGTVLTDPTSEGFTYTKHGDEWSSVGPMGYTNFVPHSSMADGATYHVQAPEGSQTADHAPAAPATSEAEFKPMSTQELKDFPTGTKITTNHEVAGGYSKPYWIKQSDGTYKEYDELTGFEPTGHTYTPFLMAEGFPLKAEPPADKASSDANPYIGKTLTDVMQGDGVSSLPVGTELHNGSHVYKKTAPNSWQKMTKETGALDPTVKEDSAFDAVPASLSDKYTVTAPSEPASTHATGASGVTGVSTGQTLSKELLDAQPVGATMKKESAYGPAAAYYIKQSDGTWKLHKNGKETSAAPYTSDNIATTGVTATIGVPTPGTKFFYSKIGEIVYAGDKVDYKGTPGTISSITDTGLISVKLNGENGAKYKTASNLIKTPNYGQKDAPSYQPPATPNLSTTPSHDNHTGGTDTHNFAGASADAYNQQGLVMPSVTDTSHLSSGLTLAPTHKADTSNPLHGTPAPQPPAAPSAYPAFSEEVIDPLPKWDSAAWLEKVKQRYADNPHKVAPTLEQSKNWTKIQSVLNGDELHLDSLLQSKYLTEELKNEAIEGIVQQEFKNKPLEQAHKLKIAEAKNKYNEDKAKYLANYTAEKEAFNKKFDEWVAANPSADAVSFAKLPDVSKENFNGGAADWTKAHAGTFSAQTVFDSIKKDDQLGTKGLSIATDSDQVEALDANVMKILDTSGKPVLQVKFKLTGPYGDAFEKTIKNQVGVSKTSDIYSNYLVKDSATGLLKDHGKPDGGWVHGGDRYTWTDPSTGAEVVFQRSHEQGLNVSSNNNTVRIHLPADATPEMYQKVLENMGVNAKPSTEGDIRVLAENQLLSMMGKSTVNTKIYDGNKNHGGATRLAQLQEIEQKYGVTPEDLTFTSESNGRVRFYLNDEKAQALADKYGVKSFLHGVHDAMGVDTWLTMLTGDNPGLLSTNHRWNEGIGGGGKSSKEDHRDGSSDYVYTIPQSHLPSGGSNVIINPKAIFRRTDWWANPSDGWGKKGLGQHSGTSSKSPYHLMDDAGHVPYDQGGLYEFLPKDTVPVSDWMYVSMSSSVRSQVLEGLKQRGVLKINGLPIEDFIISSGMAPPTGATMPVVK
jgi:hypothetical protein